MIIETNNSTYEILGNWIRVLKGQDSVVGKNFTWFHEFLYKPKIGSVLVIFFDKQILSTSIIKTIKY